MAATYSTSIGHVLSGSEWLDAHFSACRAEYAEMLGLVPFATGGRVLDAGCGSGGFIPLLEAALGDVGRVVAADIAAEHLRAGTCRVAADVRRLPLAADAFDGVWCANVTQYLDDASLIDAVAEFRRVLRPGGIVAVKDVDMRAWDVGPAPPFLGAHLAEACAATGRPQSSGSIRGRHLKGLLEEAGFDGVQQHGRVIERWAPLENVTAGFWAQWLVYLADVAADVELSADDRRFWREVESIEAARSFVGSPSFYGCELQVVAFARKAGVHD
jgi:SAM-dependent methyltransferase